MREGLEWLVALRRFLVLVGLTPIAAVWLLSRLGVLPDGGLTWGLAAAWPVLVVGLVWHYRSFMVLDEIVTFAAMLTLSILLAPWVETRLATASAAGSLLLLAGLLMGAFLLWMALSTVRTVLPLRSLGSPNKPRRSVSRAFGPVDPAAAFDALRLVPGRDNAFYRCGPLRADGWFPVDVRFFPYGGAEALPPDDDEAGEEAPPYRARIVEEGANHQIATFAAEDGSGMTTVLLQVQPRAGGCIVTTTETADFLGPVDVAKMWLQDFGRFSVGAKLDHLAGRPCRFGSWSTPRCVLTDLGNWFARRAATGQGHGS